MPEGLDKLAGAIGDTLKTAPTLYEDALQPTVQEVGKFAARIPRAINAAFSGLDKWILNKEYAIDETKKLLAQKLENVDPEKIVEPEHYVAVPAIQAISYSMNSEELRNLYANLLAKAMHSDIKDLVHPAFIEIIKQLSPTDALILNEIKINDPLLLATLTLETYKSNDFKELSYSITYRDITAITYADYYSVLVSLDNLFRLRLIKEEPPFDENVSLSNSDHEGFFFTYMNGIPQSFKRSPVYSRKKNEMQRELINPNCKYVEKYHYDYLTSFGESFRKICIDDDF